MALWFGASVAAADFLPSNVASVAGFDCRGRSTASIPDTDAPIVDNRTSETEVGSFDAYFTEVGACRGGWTSLLALADCNHASLASLSFSIGSTSTLDGGVFRIASRHGWKRTFRSSRSILVECPGGYGDIFHRVGAILERTTYLWHRTLAAFDIGLPESDVRRLAKSLFRSSTRSS